jgi:hypothetical protein
MPIDPHPCAPVHARFFLGYDSVYFLSLLTFLATSKLGRVEFRLSFSQGVVLFLWQVSLGVVASFPFVPLEKLRPGRCKI